MTAWIIEDEPPALRRLTTMLAELRPGLNLAYSTDNIASCVLALKNRAAPDVIFSDIHLADGLAFEIWEECPAPCPLVFTTAFDQYSLRAFRVNGVDYLLKPIEAEALARTLDRVDRRRPQLSPDWQRLTQLIENQQPIYRERILGRKGDNFIPIKIGELRQIYSQDGLTFALDGKGGRSVLDETLDRLTEELDPTQWFRINRAQVVSIDSILKAAPYFNHRLILELTPNGALDNLVARARVRAFKQWLGAV